MLTATLGGLIKDYRIKKRLSQQEVSLRIGWSDCSRLSKIEQGRVGKITKPTLDKIMDALDLGEYERGQMFGVSRILPTHSEVDQALNKLKKEIDYFNCPVLVVDIFWNIFYFNKQCRELYKISNKEYRFLEKNKPNWMEVLFLRKSFNDVKIRGGYSPELILPFDEYQIAHFKFEQQDSIDEPWYRKLLMKLGQDDNFKTLWGKVPMTHSYRFYEYEFNEFTGKWRGKEEILKFHVLSISPVFDSRFWIMIHQPADENTYKFYSKK